MSWRDERACVGVPVEVFFPTYEGSTLQAKRICAGCPVVAECLQYALDNDELDGVWGGLSAAERWRGRERHPSGRAPAVCGTEAGYSRHRRITFTPVCDACRAAHNAASRGRKSRRLRAV